MPRSEAEQEILHSKNWAEVLRNFRKFGRIKREVCNDSTVKLYGEYGMVPIHNHPTQAPKTGTLCGMIRMAKIAGILAEIGLILHYFGHYFVKL